MVQTTDPIQVTSLTELQLARQVHDTLYRLSPTGEIVPSLAHDLPKLSAGGKELLIQLRPGASFHDGTPLTADEVIASWKRLIRRKSGSPYWWMLAPVRGALAFRTGKSTKIAGIEKVNRLTIRVRLSSGMPDFLEVLTAIPTAPLPSLWNSAKEPGRTHPPGSGPFAWSSDRTSSEVSALEAFQGHPRGRPFVDRLLLKNYLSARAASLAFQLEEVHLAWERPSRDTGRYNTVDGPLKHQVMLAVNPGRVDRLPQGFIRAVAQAMDRQSLVRYVVGERGVETDELLNIEGAQVSSPALSGNPVAAREYFERVVQQERGVPPVLVFLVREGDSLERAVAERIQVNLVDIGVAVSVVAVNRQEHESRLRSGNYDFHLVRPLPFFRSPDLQLLGIVAELMGEEEVAQYLQMLDKLPDDANRKSLVRERSRRYQASLARIPLFRHSRRIFLHESVRDYSLGVNGLVNLADVWLAD
jgi:ABC-type transport system substrate-binding protein